MLVAQSGTLREVAAKAIYRARPYYLGEKRSVMEGVGIATPLAWDGAPAFYQQDCYEIADVVLSAIGGAA